MKNYFDSDYDNRPKLDDNFFNDPLIDNRKKLMMKELDFIDNGEFQMPSELISNTDKANKKKKKKKKNEIIVYEDDNEPILDTSETDEWDDVLNEIKTTKHKKRFNIDKLFEDSSKKKKKKKKEGSLVNHKKDFEPELVLLRNLQMDQAKFVNSLQKKYDQMESTKATARGVNKFTTDLIQSITGARSVQMQLIDKVISTKKTIADLDFKERKEFGGNSNSEQVNLNNYASTYLRQMIDAGRTNVTNSGYLDMPEDLDEEDLDNLFDSIDDSLGETDRSDDVEKYLKYENDNVNVVVHWYDSVDSDDIRDKYDYVAIDSNFEEVPDYPLPLKGKININRSTGFATDEYGNKYKLFVHQ